MCVSLWLILFTLFTYHTSSGLFTLSTLLPELVSLFLKNDKINFDMSELKWIVASLMFFRFFLYTFFLKSLNFRSVDTLSAQLHCHMDYSIYWRHANSTHLPYSFACNFEFSSLVIRIWRSTKSQNCTILLFSNFTYQKSARVCRPCWFRFANTFLLKITKDTILIRKHNWPYSKQDVNFL